MIWYENYDMIYDNNYDNYVTNSTPFAQATTGFNKIYMYFLQTIVILFSGVRCFLKCIMGCVCVVSFYYGLCFVLCYSIMGCVCVVSFYFGLCFVLCHSILCCVCVVTICHSIMGCVLCCVILLWVVFVL